MSYNWKIVTDKLYGILKGSCITVSMYDAKGNETIDPDEATRFFATCASHDKKLDDFSILVAIHDEGQSSFINIKTPNLADDTDFKKVHQIQKHIRNAIGQREGIKVSWQVFDREIDPREEVMNNIKESKDIGKWSGTTKSSFLKIGEAKLIVRHTDTVNEEKAGSRTRHIRALFVENKAGERFAYPHLHMTGAKAFARHISNGGTNHDSIAEGIIALSSDYSGLRRAANTMRQHRVISEWIVGIRESIGEINRRLKSLHGPKGYANAESILSNQPVILDENKTNTLWQKLAEECECGEEDPSYSDLGVAAKYLGGVDNQPTPVTFSWHRRPNISGAPDGSEMLERLQWQISELASACSDQHAAARLIEIAGMIAANIKPTEEDISFVREAMSSSVTHVHKDTIPEEEEFENFLNEFAPERIFATESPNDTPQEFIIGDKVKHKTQKLGVGQIVADPEMNEYPVKFSNDPDIYYVPAEDLILVNTDESVFEEDNDEYDDDSELNNGSYVVDTDQPRGEVFRVSQYEPGARRCWIGDKFGRGWYISLNRLVICNDANRIKKWFGTDINDDGNDDEYITEMPLSTDTLKSYIDKAKASGAAGYGGKGPFTNKDFKRSVSIGRAQDIVHNRENPIVNPKVHDFSTESDGSVYDLTQTSDDIHDGDVLKLSKGRTAILMRAWPVMIVGDSKALHHLKPGRSWEKTNDGKYLKSVEVAKSAATPGATHDNNDDEYITEMPVKSDSHKSDNFHPNMQKLGMFHGKAGVLAQNIEGMIEGDLEEEESDNSPEWIQGLTGKVIAQTGDYYLLFNPDRYDRQTVKYEYEVYKKDGNNYHFIENMNLPYKRPSDVIPIFNEKYGKGDPNGITDQEMSNENASLLERIKNLAGM